MGADAAKTYLEESDNRIKKFKILFWIIFLLVATGGIILSILK